MPGRFTTATALTARSGSPPRSGARRRWRDTSAKCSTACRRCRMTGAPSWPGCSPRPAGRRREPVAGAAWKRLRPGRGHHSPPGPPNSRGADQRHGHGTAGRRQDRPLSAGDDLASIAEAFGIPVTRTPAPYGAGPIKRQRATRDEMAARHDALFEIVRAAQPTGIRFTYYTATTRGIVPKTKTGYRKVQRAILQMRREERIPWDWIVDTNRWMRKPSTWGSIEEVLTSAAAGYRRALWRDSIAAVEVWCESESVAGVLYPVTSKWDVPLYPIKADLRLVRLRRRADLSPRPAAHRHLLRRRPRPARVRDRVQPARQAAGALRPHRHPLLPGGVHGRLKWPPLSCPARPRRSPTTWMR